MYLWCMCCNVHRKWQSLGVDPNHSLGLAYLNVAPWDANHIIVGRAEAKSLPSGVEICSFARLTNRSLGPHSMTLEIGLVFVFS
jgi:hypothetical protein